MNCSRCSAEAVVKRDNAFYCGKCAMARDWEDVIAVVQHNEGGGVVVFGDEVIEELQASTVAVESAPPPPAPAPSPVAAAPEPAEERVAEPEPQPAPVVATNSNGELPADPFG